MYQSLYRKYRPRNFSEVYGQNIAKTILINSIKKSQLSHAYLFFGPRGTGKTSLAKMFARICNCESPNDGNCCEKCEYCLESSQKNCIDIIEIDAASNNGVDEIRELKNKITLVPNKLKYKVYIIDEVHMLSTGAFNALLKTLEEPPEHVIFILATTDYYKVPSTIISRCQTIEFKNIDNISMHDRLLEISNIEKIDIDDMAINEIVYNSNGGLRDALGLLDKLNSYASLNEHINQEMVRNLVGTISDSEISSFVENLVLCNKKCLLEKIEDYASSGKDLIKILGNIISYMCDEAVKENNNDYSEFLNGIYDYYIDIKRSSDPKILFKILVIDLCSKTNVRECRFADSENSPSKEIITNESNVKKSNDDNKHEDKKTLLSEVNIDHRINNCFVEPNKSLLLGVKKQWSLLKDYVFDQEIGANVCDLLDTTPTVVSNKYILLVSNYDSSADKVNQNLDLFENIILNKLFLSQKIVCVSTQTWNKLREEYLQKIKKGDKFVYIDEENVDINISNVDIDSNVESKAKELFGDVFN